MVLQLKAHIVEICEWSGGMVKYYFLSPGVSFIIDPSGTAPTSEPATETTLPHQPTPPLTGMSLVAVINTWSTRTKHLYI